MDESLRHTASLVVVDQGGGGIMSSTHYGKGLDGLNPLQAEHSLKILMGLVPEVRKSG